MNPTNGGEQNFSEADCRRLSGNLIERQCAAVPISMETGGIQTREGDKHNATLNNPIRERTHAPA